MKLPLWPLRVAVFQTLTEHAATAAYTSLADGEEGPYPHYGLGPVMMGEAGTDSHAGHTFTVQIDAWALSAEAGGKVVAQMLDAATEALGADLAVEGFGYASYVGVGSALFSEDRDPQTKKELFHGAIRFKYLIFNA